MKYLKYIPKISFLFTLFMIALLVVCCNTSVETYQIKETRNGQHFQIMIIDSCEYLGFSNNMPFAHKGNCRFCQQRTKNLLKQELDKNTK